MKLRFFLPTYSLLATKSAHTSERVNTVFPYRRSITIIVIVIIIIILLLLLLF